MARIARSSGSSSGESSELFNAPTLRLRRWAAAGAADPDELSPVERLLAVSAS
ncbi:hypothetical protein GCM10023354_11750 [Garicola koreensis]